MPLISQLKVTLSRTSDDLQDYLQIMSSDQTTINVVLIANHINVTDSRRKTGSKPQTRKVEGS